MKLWVEAIILLVIGFAPCAVAQEHPSACSKDQHPNEFTVLSYHEIAEKGETLDSSYTVTPARFEEQILWLKKKGYHFISMDDVLAHRTKGRALPEKAVLMSFDDGYQSVYVHAYPLLKKHKIPAVIALVGSWMKAQKVVDFSGEKIDRDKFLSRREIREMVKSGLIEIASHSYDSHYGIRGNPQGNTQPALTTRAWLSQAQRYETQREYEKRIYHDLRESSLFLERYTGQKPRIIVWPYGRYNIDTRKMAHKAGMDIGLTLDDGSNTRFTPLWGLRRILVESDMSLNDLEYDMWLRNLNVTDNGRNTKAAHVDLDYMYDPDPKQQQSNIDALIGRIRLLGVNTVYLQAFADPDGNGAADYTYFPNRHIPMKADLFNHVAWQIRTRTPVKRLYAWMPMMAWELPKNHRVAQDKVVTLQVDPSHLNMGYPRLSPFSPKARSVIREIFEDLGKSAYFDGILFHDDVTLSDFEDDSVFARQQYKRWHLSGDVMSIRKDPKQLERWTVLKIRYLDRFAMELGDMLRTYQPGLKTARNMYAQVVLHPYAPEWYAQDFRESLRYYDYTAIMAMPYMEEAPDAKAFFDQMIRRIKTDECGLEKTVVELQSVNWRQHDEPLSTEEFTGTIRYLYQEGINHIAYYPDNVFKNNPNAEATRTVLEEKPLRMNTLGSPSN